MEQAFLNSVQKRALEYKTLGDKTIQQLEESDLNAAPAPGSNSIAVIVRHLHGNMRSRWTHFLTEDGEKPWRSREAEFAPDHLAKDVVIEMWEEGWQVFLSALAALQPADLQRTITIRYEPLLVVDAVMRQVVHYAGHVGQIVYIGKMLKGAHWQSLSIQQGGSEAFNQQMQAQHDPTK